MNQYYLLRKKNKMSIQDKIKIIQERIENNSVTHKKQISISEDNMTTEELYKYWGVDFRIRNTKRLTEEQKEIGKYAEKGFGIELGCGKKKSHSNAIGIDLHHDSVAEIKADCRDLWMFEDSELDFVINSHTLEHLPDTISVLKEWVRVLKVGGILAIAVPDGELKPKYILRNGHKVNLGLKTLSLILHGMMRMKILVSKHVEKNSASKIVALIVAMKTK